MLIVGAKGFAIEILEILYLNKYNKSIAFYDDINSDINGKLFGKYQILKNEEDVKVFFQKNGPLYTIGIGLPCLLYTSPSPRDLSTSRMPSSA